MNYLALAFGDIGDPDDDENGLGDIICVEGDCKEGEANVEQLGAFVATLTDAQRQKWKSAVAQVVDSFNKAEGRFSRHIPFSTVCCELKAIGEQARKLVDKIGFDEGVHVAGKLEAPRSGIESLISGLVTVGAVVAAVVIVGEVTHRRNPVGRLPATSPTGR